MSRELKKLFLVLNISLLFLTFGCADDRINNSSISYEEITTNEPDIYAIQTSVFKEELSNPKDTMFSISATSESSKLEGKIGKNLVISGLEEAIFLSFAHTGKDRKISLCILYDYTPVKFRVGVEKDLVESYETIVKNNTKIVLPIFLDESIPKDELAHRLVFIIIPGSDEYARDKENPAYNASLAQMYQLHYGKYISDREHIIDEAVKLVEPKHYDFSSVPLVLNTDDIDFEREELDVVTLPSKYYEVDGDDTIEMNALVSNILPAAETAVIFVTIGNRHAKINGSDYIWIDLSKELMSVTEVVLDLPDEGGVYDVVGYVVYDPFQSMTFGENTFPQVSIRFTIER